MATTGAHGIIIPDPSTANATVNQVRDLAIQTEAGLADVEATVVAAIDLDSYATKTYVGNALGPYATRTYVDDALSGIGTSGTTFISTATYMIVEAGDYIATRSTTLTMPSGAQVALSTGQFVVVVDIGGSLYVSEVGTLQDGGPAPTPKIQVTPTGPTWSDDTDNGGGTWSTPTQTGVTYDPASGTASPGQSVTVTATPTAGYEFPVGAATSWSHAFPVNPPAVTHLKTWTTEGKIADSATGQTVTFDAAGATVPEDGLLVVAISSWSGSGSVTVGGEDITDNPVAPPWVADFTNKMRMEPVAAGHSLDTTVTGVNSVLIVSLILVTNVNPVPYSTMSGLSSDPLTAASAPPGSIALGLLSKRDMPLEPWASGVQRITRASAPINRADRPGWVGQHDLAYFTMVDGASKTLVGGSENKVGVVLSPGIA